MEDLSNLMERADMGSVYMYQTIILGSNSNDITISSSSIYIQQYRVESHFICQAATYEGKVTSNNFIILLIIIIVY